MERMRKFCEPLRRDLLLSIVWLGGSAVGYTIVFYVWHGHAPW